MTTTHTAAAVAAVLARLRADRDRLTADKDAAWKAIDHSLTDLDAPVDEAELWGVYADAARVLGALDACIAWYEGQAAAQQPQEGGTA